MLVCLVLPAVAFAWQPVAARKVMVVSSEPHASDVGLEILRAGGNAVDAAVAVGFALAVTHPEAGNIGGGGFMLIRLAGGEAVVIDYREAAPAAATAAMYLDERGELKPEASTIGALAVAVPGTVAGLWDAHQKYGRLKWSKVLKPSIDLAKKGFTVSLALSQSLREHEVLLSRFPEICRIFLRDGRFYEPGEVFRQPELARTLWQIARRGPEDFYRGRTAEAIVATMKKHQGLISEQDLREYQPKVRKPLVGHFRSYEVVTVPPPSSGGVGLIEMLNVLDPLELGSPNSFASIRLMAETMRRAYADRAAFLGDADFVSVPVERLTSQSYAAKLREEVRQAVAAGPLVPQGELRPALQGTAEAESPETTHFSVIDAEGNAVANTYTLDGFYGSGLTVEGAGFLLNNEMDDFTAKPGTPNMFGLVQSEANAIAPRKRPLSSMTPTIIVEGGKVRLVLGSPGGGTIINTVLQVILNVLVHHMDIRQAVTAPRFHHQWAPDELVMEGWGFSADTLERLQQAGYKLQFRERMGACEAIEVDPQTGWKFGATDPRTNGKAVGY